LLLTGLLAGLVPGGAQAVSAIGAVLVVGVTAPVTVYTVVQRRRNQKAYDAAVAASRETGQIVRVIETTDGRYTYALAPPPAVERMAWPPPAEAADAPDRHPAANDPETIS
jgi:hypothetical protein